MYNFIKQSKIAYKEGFQLKLLFLHFLDNTHSIKDFIFCMIKNLIMITIWYFNIL